MAKYIKGEVKYVLQKKIGVFKTNKIALQENNELKMLRKNSLKMQSGAIPLNNRRNVHVKIGGSIRWKGKSISDV